jgi:hypothetical protein
MTLPTLNLSKPALAKAIRVVTLTLVFVVFAAGAAFAQNNGQSPNNIVPVKSAVTKTAIATDEQVVFTATGTAAITSVTQLPSGLTEVNFNTSGKATHLGDFTGPLMRIQDHQGTFGSTAVIIGANGKDTVFLSVSGHFEHTRDKCLFTSTGIYTVTGGGGAFANATGSGTIETQIDLCAGTAKGTYTGTISKPHLD